MISISFSRRTVSADMEDGRNICKRTSLKQLGKNIYRDDISKMKSAKVAPFFCSC